MGLDISFRRISFLLVIGLILLTASALANASLSAAGSWVNEIAKTPVVWDPMRGGGVQTITKTCAASNACTYKPQVQQIARGSGGIGKFVRSAVNPWSVAAMLTAGWAWDSANSWWDKNFSVWGWLWKNHVSDKMEGPIMSRADAIKKSKDSVLAKYSANGMDLLSYPVVDTDTAYQAWYWVWRSCPTSSEPLRKCGVATDVSVLVQRSSNVETFEQVAEEADVWDAFVSSPDQANSWQVATENGNALQPWQDLFPESAPVPEVDPLPQISPADAILLNLLAQGLLQSLDPNAPHYVTPDELARLQQLAQQMADALNQKAKDAQAAWDQPLTQPQYDESNARDRAEFASALPDPNFLPDPEESLQQQIDFVNRREDEPPAGPDVKSLWKFSTGTCNGFNLPVSAGGHSYTITVNKQCEYYPTFNAAMNWFLYLLTAFQVFHLFHRNMTRIM